MKATPLPVVSTMYSLVLSPPFGKESVRPASLAMSRKSGPGGGCRESRGRAARPPTAPRQQRRRGLSLLGRPFAKPLQKVAELALGRMLELLQFLLLPPCLVHLAGIAIGEHETVVSRFIVWLHPDHPLQQRDCLGVLSGLHANSADGQGRFGKVGAQFESPLEMLESLLAPAAGVQDLPDLELGRSVSGVQRQFGLELLLRLGQRFRAVRLEQNRAAQAEVQVERPRVLLDRFTVLGGRFRELVLRFEDLTR